MVQRSWPVAVVIGLLICLSLACASLARTPTQPPATATASLAAASATAAPTETASSAPASDATTPAAAAALASATPAPNATQPPAATPSEAAAATAIAIPTQTGGLGHTGPSDIPVINDATTKILTATDMQVVYQTGADVATLVKYYKDQMPLNGWTLGGTVTEIATTMTFTKGTRSATVSILAPAGGKPATVSIVIVGK